VGSDRGQGQFTGQGFVVLLSNLTWACEGLRRSRGDLRGRRPGLVPEVPWGDSTPLHPKWPDPGTVGGGAGRLLRVPGWAARTLVDEPALSSGIRGVRAELCSLGGGARIVREVEELVG